MPVWLVAVFLAGAGYGLYKAANPAERHGRIISDVVLSGTSDAGPWVLSIPSGTYVTIVRDDGSTYHVEYMVQGAVTSANVPKEYVREEP